MKIFGASWEYIVEPNGEEFLKIIEKAGKLCYQSLSDKKSTPEDFVKKAIKLGHHSIIEHVSVGVKIITDRGVTHELVRHRLASYSQESTRYCNYAKDKFGNELKFIQPRTFILNEADRQILELIEKHYLYSINQRGLSPQQARFFLPNGLKTEIVVTCNVREWRHIFQMRVSPKAHPDISRLMKEILEDFQIKMPILFDDIIVPVG